MRIVGILFAILSIGLLVAGCAGESRHHVTTPGNGTLEGMRISPTPQTTDLDTDSIFTLSWSGGYEPPSDFYFTLDIIDANGFTTRLNTVRYDDPSGYAFNFEPAFYLPSNSFLLVTVRANGETERAMYLTEASLYSAATRKPSLVGEALPEHHVITHPAAKP